MVVDRNRVAAVLNGYVEVNAINQAIADARRNSTEAPIKDPFVRQLNQTCANPRPRRRPPNAPTTRRRQACLRQLERRSPSYSAAFASLKAPAGVQARSSARSRRPDQGRALRSRCTGGFLGKIRRYDRDARLRAAGPQVRRTPAPPPASSTARPRSPRPRLGGVDRERFAEHLSAPAGRGVPVPGGHDGAAGGAACGDLIRITLRVEGDRVAPAGFEASGCGALTAAASAAVTLVEGEPLLDAARVGAHAISEELGGLSPGKFHAADLVADALHGALGRAAHAQARARRPTRGARSSR